MGSEKSFRLNNVTGAKHAKISIRFKVDDPNPVVFEEWGEVIRYMMAAELPWNIQLVKHGTQQKQMESYKRRVRGRAIIVYGDQGASIRVLSDRDFCYDLKKLGEIYDIKLI